VTKKGGLVVATDTDDGPLFVYPESPKTMEILDKLGEYARRNNVNRFIGRELYWIFYQAGLTSINIYPLPFFGVKGDREAYQRTSSVLYGMLDSVKDSLVSDGAVSDKDYIEMHAEAERNMEHPGSIIFGSMFTAVGKVE